MPRKAQFPPRVTRHATGQARCHHQGKDYWLGLYGTPQARRAYAELLVRLTADQDQPAAPAPRPSAPGAVAEVAAAFLDAAEKEKHPEQVRLYRAALAPLVRLVGTLPAADFDDLHLERIRDAMLSGSWMNDRERRRREKQGQPVSWCRAVTNNHVRRIRTVWRWAERQRLVPRGAWMGLRVLPALRQGTPGVRDYPRRQGSTREELDQVLPFIQPGRRHRPCATMLLVQFLAGMRSCEVCLMRPGDIDRDGGPTADGVKVWLYRPHRSKTPHRVVVLGPQAQALLAPYLLKSGPEEYLFRPQHRAYPYATRVYDTTIRRACARAGVKVQPYLGRHSMKDRAAREGGLDGARSVLGHATLTMTHQYGEQRDIQKAAEIIAKLG